MKAESAATTAEGRADEHLPEDVTATQPAHSTAYTLVHLVAGETTKDLVIPQVVSHMALQARTEGPLRPRRVVIAFLEPARVAMRRAIRRHVRTLRRATPGVRVMLIPYVSRFSIKANAAIIGHLMRLRIGGGDVVFHCRGESTVSWAAEMSKQLGRAGIVADIRGAQPEETLAGRGFATLEEADARSSRDFHFQLAAVQNALSRAQEVFTVSAGMREWLETIGIAAERIHYVPCCVSRVAYSPDVRARMRRTLGFGDELVYAFLGSAWSYGIIGDGLTSFLRATFGQFADTRLLMLTDQPDQMRARLAADGIPPSRATVLRVPHGEVWGYLCAADCGCILKAPGRLNRTWQPVKLGEYLGCGLPVIVSRGVGRVDGLIQRSGAGLVVDIFGRGDPGITAEAARVHNALCMDGEAMRNRALNLCRDEFLWNCYIDQVRAAYARSVIAGAASARQ